MKIVDYEKVAIEPKDYVSLDGAIVFFEFQYEPYCYSNRQSPGKAPLTSPVILGVSLNLIQMQVIGHASDMDPDGLSLVPSPTECEALGTT